MEQVWNEWFRANGLLLVDVIVCGLPVNEDRTITGFFAEIPAIGDIIALNVGCRSPSRFRRLSAPTEWRHHVDATEPVLRPAIRVALVDESPESSQERVGRYGFV